LESGNRKNHRRIIPPAVPAVNTLAWEFARIRARPDAPVSRV